MSAQNMSYQEILTEYRFALGIWTETKALYGPDGPELLQAAMRLEYLENALANRRMLVAA
jgi:hypothetical protein